MRKTLDAVTDPNLSWEAKGLLFELEFYGAAGVQLTDPDVKQALADLVKHGYLSENLQQKIGA